MVKDDKRIMLTIVRVQFSRAKYIFIVVNITKLQNFFLVKLKFSAH